LTTTYPAPTGFDAASVYQPQHDSQLLVDTMEETGIVAGRRVLDLCTGSGYVAIAAAEMGCASVTAFDICPVAVQCSRDKAIDAGVEVDIRLGSWTKAMGCPKFEVVVCNPPYVPTPPPGDGAAVPPNAGPAWSWDAGPDGRLILDPLCKSVSKLLCDGGSTLLVHSEFADPQRSLQLLRSSGMTAEIVASQRIPFGPVLSAHAQWLEDTGQLQRGRREEELVVIRADK
jgi:release factor glutamine methyltransferase